MTERARAIPSPDELLAVAQQAARLSGAILREGFDKQRTIEFKGGIDLVTDADRTSEAALIRYIREQFPDHSILAEESGLSGGTGLRWIIDPLDGTTNYSHRLPMFCVSIAVDSSEGLLAGVVYDPLRDELFSAAKGRGATLNGKQIRTSEVASIQRALLCSGFPYDVREHPEAPLGLFNHLTRLAQGVRRLGSAALDLSYVAAGRLDGFFEFGLKPWDIAAGALLVMEAGGAISQMDGSPLDLTAGNVVASGKPLAGELIRECARFVAEIGWKPRR